MIYNKQVIDYRNSLSGFKSTLVEISSIGSIQNEGAVKDFEDLVRNLK